MARKSRLNTTDLLAPEDRPNGLSDDGAVSVLEGAPARPAKGKARKAGAASETGIIHVAIPEPDICLLRVPIVGRTSLIVHAWSQKAVQMILDKQTKAAQKAKEAKDPEKDYEDSQYVADEGWLGIPSVAFKAALVGACRQVDGISMTLAKRLAFARPDGVSTRQNIELTRILGEPRMRRDMVRVASGTADVRFRAEFPQWEAVLQIEYNAQMITVPQLVSLIQIAGYSEGVGEWRPSAPESATGTHGRWRVKPGAWETTRLDDA